MISIIVCFRKAEDLEKLEKNVLQTSGVPVEVIGVDNSTNAYSICQAYNLGARQSNYSLLCFLHEDVAFEMNGWGIILHTILENAEIGLVGLAGSTIKSKATGPAWWSPMPQSLRLHLMQQNSDGDKKMLQENPFQEKLSQVVTLDGVLLACRKEVWEEYPFDQQTVQGFHFYDLDFALAIGQKYKIFVSHEIVLRHFSEGTNDRIWAEHADLIHRKWRKQLPKYIGEVSNMDLLKNEKDTAEIFLHKLFETQSSWKLKVKYVILRCRHNPFEIKTNWYF